MAAFFRKSQSLVFYELIPLLALLLSTTTSNAQELESFPISGLMDNATSFLQDFSKKFDSTKNITLNPSSLFQRMRERLHNRMEHFRERWLEKRIKLGNRTISLIDRIMKRLDYKEKSKVGNESGQETFGMFRSFLDSLRNTVQGMVQNWQASALKRPVKLAEDASVALKDQLEREVPGSKSIAELNAALKKLDKETRQKFNSI